VTGAVNHALTYRVMVDPSQNLQFFYIHLELLSEEKYLQALCHPPGTKICTRWTEVDTVPSTLRLASSSVDTVTITNTTGLIDCNKTELYEL
jgi:hypothetical protein